MTLDNSTCCRLSLKHATIIIGTVSSIFAFMSMLLSATYAEHPTELIEMADPSIVPDSESLRIILIICAVITGLQCIFSILIIFGAETNRPMLLVPWLIYNPLFITIYLISTITGLVKHSDNNKVHYVIAHLIFACVFSAVFFWKYSAVYRLHKYLKSLNF